jgi:hypothetical protein
MSLSLGNRMAAGVVLAVVGGLGGGGLAGARAEASPERSIAATPQVAASTVRHFSADLAVRHRRVTPAGVPIGLLRPDVVMRLVRERGAGGWTTTLSVPRVPEALIEGLAGPVRLPNPFHVSRVEMVDGEDRPRLFDRLGRPVAALTPDDLRLVGVVDTLRQRGSGGRDATDGLGTLLAEAGRQHERRAELERRFGSAADRVRGLDRYISTSAGVRTEVLVTPDTVLPVELLTTSASAGHMRTGVSYQAHGAYGHVRRLIRSEHHFGNAGAGRAVTEVELANVVLSGEVRP